MHLTGILFYGLAAVAAAWWMVAILPHLLPRRRRPEDPRAGLVIFVEPVRWLSVRWGLRPLTAGLRRAGFDGQVMHWRWHSAWRAWLVLPVMMARSMLERQAQRLAEFIANQRRQDGDRPIYLVGYSCGGYVAARALELLPPELAVDAAAILAGSFSPRRDLSAACRAVRGKLIVSSSLADWLIVGVGTLLFGAADRKYALSVGMVGLQRPPGEHGRKLIEIRWHPGMVRLGHLGGHFTAAAGNFVARHLAPAMGIPRARPAR